MGRLSLLSGALFVLPIAITIGVLVGLETYQTSRGQKGLGPIDASNGIQTNTYCQKAYGVVPAPGRYICEYIFAPALASHPFRQRFFGTRILLASPGTGDLQVTLPGWQTSERRPP